MITAAKFKTLNHGNLSVDAEKSKTRILEEFKATSREQKAEIRKLTGFPQFNNFYNAGRSGVASPKVVISLSQVLNISPRYFTGEIDAKEPCDATELTKLFKENSGGNKKSAKAQTDKPKKKTAETKATDKPSVKKANMVVKPTKHVKPAKTDSKKQEPTPKPVDKAVKRIVDEETLVKLLIALAIRAQFGGEAKINYDKVVELLVK